MAVTQITIDDQTFDIEHNSIIRDICEQAGVPFNCRSGLCGTCQIEVLEGDENLSTLSQEEEDMGMDQYHRLACQCMILDGPVKITY